jgi:hypothetical protein
MNTDSKPNASTEDARSHVQQLDDLIKFFERYFGPQTTAFRLRPLHTNAPDAPTSDAILKSLMAAMFGGEDNVTGEAHGCEICKEAEEFEKEFRASVEERREAIRQSPALMARGDALVERMARLGSHIESVPKSASIGLFAMLVADDGHLTEGDRRAIEFALIALQPEA